MCVSLSAAVAGYLSAVQPICLGRSIGVYPSSREVVCVRVSFFFLQYANMGSSYRRETHQRQGLVEHTEKKVPRFGMRGLDALPVCLGGDYEDDFIVADPLEDEPPPTARSRPARDTRNVI